jgi:hypothetical protein
MTEEIFDVVNERDEVVGQKPGQKKIFKIHQRHIRYVRFQKMPPQQAGDFLGCGFYKNFAPNGAWARMGHRFLIFWGWTFCMA